jgi:hypothetical protein
MRSMQQLSFKWFQWVDSIIPSRTWLRFIRILFISVYLTSLFTLTVLFNLGLVYGPYWSLALSMLLFMLTLHLNNLYQFEKLKAVDLYFKTKNSQFIKILFGIGLLFNYYLIFSFLALATWLIWTLTILLLFLQGFFTIFHKTA